MRIRLTLSLAMLCMAFAATAQKYRAIITTDSGTIQLSLYDKTPQHRDNFVKLAKKHFYDGTLFHRVIPGFMIQGGDPNSKTAEAGKMLGDGDVGYRIPAEIVDEYYHKQGALAAARDNNPDKSSSGCQFYIVTGKTFTDAELDAGEKRAGRKFTEEQRNTYKTVGGAPHLDGNYTVFGEVTKGMDVALKIQHAKRNRADRPDENQVIRKLRVQKKFLFFWI
jgi:cyclophilin family peptidyl-prolyl cis-trans isomerase